MELVQNVNFNIDGNRISFKGCNNNRSNFKLKYQNIKLSPWASTKMFCPNDNDPEIIAVFEKVKFISMNKQDNTISFKKKGGKVLLKLGRI